MPLGAATHEANKLLKNVERKKNMVICCSFELVTTFLLELTPDVPAEIKSQIAESLFLCLACERHGSPRLSCTSDTDKAVDRKTGNQEPVTNATWENN